MPLCPRQGALNPAASAKVAHRLIEAHRRGFWTPDPETRAALDQAEEARRPGGAPAEKSARTRIVISTHTIALQEQLIGKDIPFLNAVLPLEFSAAAGERPLLAPVGASAPPSGMPSEAGVRR